METIALQALDAPSGPKAQQREALRDRLRPFSVQLRWAVDTLIPADISLGMPSATEADVLDKHLPQVLLVRDDMAEAFFAAIKCLPLETPDALHSMAVLKASTGEGFGVFSRLVAGAFFLNEEVNERLRYPAQIAIRETPDYDYLIEAIEPLIERGEIYTKMSAE